MVDGSDTSPSTINHRPFPMPVSPFAAIRVIRGQKAETMTKRDYIRRKALVMGQTLDDLLPTYDQDGSNPISGCLPLPSESEVVLVLQLLDSVFFPGYREECPAIGKSGQGYPIDTLITERLDEVYDRLFRQVTRAIPFRWASEYARARSVPIADIDVEAEADAIVGHFFS